MKKTAVAPRDKLLPKLSLASFNHPRLAALLWLVLFTFGILSYTVLLKREGFPSVSIPVVLVTGSYAVDDAEKVDADLGKPISDIALKQTGISAVQTSSQANFLTASLQYKENISADAAKKALQKAVTGSLAIPKSAKLNFVAPYFGATGGSMDKIDAAISLYSPTNRLSTAQLTEQAHAAVKYLNAHKPASVTNFFVEDPFTQVINPITGQPATIQRTFDRFGERSHGVTSFHDSVIIGATKTKDFDAVQLDDQIGMALADLQNQPEFSSIRTTVSASFAPSIKEEISELQRVLLEGLIAVLVVGSIVIALRASLITVVSMLTVIASAIGLLYLIGYSLNVITLFGLILGLSLIVDDTIIMVEALDAARRRESDPRVAVKEATRKISRAMVAATLTACLSFAPLLFVGGILGGFIRAIPVTIISALLISLIVALVFIPLFARFVLLGKKQMGEASVKEVAAGIEARLARVIARPMVWARGVRKREFTVGIIAVVIGLGFVLGGAVIAKGVAFNIFPPSKDTNTVAVSLTFPAGTSIEQAAATTTRADAITADVLGPNLVQGSYYGTADNQSATLNLELIPYGERSVTAPQLVGKLKNAFKDFHGARVSAYAVDVGPPTSGFTINITANDRPAAVKLANDMARYLKGNTLTRPSGTKATITDAAVANTDTVTRVEGKPVVSVNATFDGTDTSTLVTLAQNLVKGHYDQNRLAGFGLSTKDVGFDIGEESDNQNSFKALLLAFPILLAVVYVLLAVQFRSLLQPLLIFTALPFSFFGIALGLRLTHNPFSFFAMLGFFALIGLSIKNTILLTDYANQARRSGFGPVDAAVAALGERFRPLIATSITAVVSLIPLAVTSPFWEGLAVVLIFGLLSSTLLVITVFPYFYLGAEYLRLRISRTTFLSWFLPLVVVAAGLLVLQAPVLLFVWAVAFTMAFIAVKMILRQR